MGTPLASGSVRTARVVPRAVRARRRECERIRRRHARTARAQRPIQPPAVSGPVQIEPCVARDALHRIRLRRGTDVDRTTRPRERRDVGLEPFLERDPLPIRRRRELRGVVAADVLDFIAARQRRFEGRETDAQERELLVPDFTDVNARPRVIELGCRAALGDEDGIAAGGRHDIDARVLTEIGAACLIAPDLPEHDLLTVRRKRRLDVVTGRVHHIASRAAIRAHDADAPHLGVGPGHVDDPLAVARERREEFECAVLCQSPRLARRAAPLRTACRGRCRRRFCHRVIPAHRATSGPAHRRDAPSAETATRR